MNKGIKEITITIDDDGKEITLSYEEWKTIFYALKPVIEPVIVKDYTPIFPNYPPKNDFYGPGLVPAPWEMPTPIWCGDGTEVTSGFSMPDSDLMNYNISIKYEDE